MTSRESFSEPSTSRFQGDDAIRQAANAAWEFGEAQWLGDDERARLCIVVEELVANLYDHGGLTKSDEFDLGLVSEPDGIRITIVDPGSPFDPRNAPRKKNLAEDGGVGVDIVRAWAQILSYEVLPEGNRLELLLPIDWKG